MHASCQEKFKHSIPPQPAIDIFKPPFPREPGATIESSNCRINITFRFYRPDFRPSSIPRCDCGVPTILRPDMKNTIDGETDRYWWTCYAGAQNEGHGCRFWKVMDMKGEGRAWLHSFGDDSSALIRVQAIGLSDVANYRSNSNSLTIFRSSYYITTGMCVTFRFLLDFIKELLLLNVEHLI